MSSERVQEKRLSAVQAATRIGGGMTAKRVRYLALRGDLASIKIGRNIVVSRPSLEAKVAGPDQSPTDPWFEGLTISVAEAAAALRIREGRVRRLVRTGTVEAVKLGRLWYVLKAPFLKKFGLLFGGVM